MVVRLIHGPLSFGVSWTLTWSSYALVLLLAALASFAAAIRVVHRFHAEDMDDIEDRCAVVCFELFDSASYWPWKEISSMCRTCMRTIRYMSVLITLP